MTPVYPIKKEDLLLEAARSMGRKSGYMAQLLSAYLNGDLSAQRMSSALGCSPEAAVRLALMRQPRSEPALFRKDVAALSAAVGIQPLQLAAVIRTALSLEAFGGEEHGDLLAAARDVTDSDTGKE